MKNIEVAKLLREIGDILELKEIPFKPRAFHKAALTIESMSDDIEDYFKQDKLLDIPSVGKGISKLITEFFETGSMKELKKLRKEVPIDLESLNKVQGLGPKTIKLLYMKLKVKNLDDLKKAAKRGKIESIKGLGKKFQDNLIHEIDVVKSRPNRMLLGHAYPIADELKERLSQLKSVKQVEIAGSFRRGRETVGDLDILTISNNQKEVMDFFTSMKDVKKVLAKGSTRSSIRLDNGLDVDIRVVKGDAFGAALMYFTGSKMHNIQLRKIALKKGLTLNEYGLAGLKDKKRIGARSEEVVYKKLGLKWIPPELRENVGEIELARRNKLPHLVELKDVKGDFQIQTNWSDGAHSIPEMVEKAESLGWKHLTITDHVGNIGVANPLDRKRLLKQIKEIEKLNKSSSIKIFAGAEVDILKNGKLAMDKDVLKKLDVVLGSIHSAFKMSEKEMTNRVISAMENYPFHIFAHPTARRINVREPVALNMEKIADVCKERNIFLEINGQPGRMDLHATHVRMAKQRKCHFSIGSDAHSKEELELVKYGVITARRGGLEKKDILNCWNLKKIEKSFN
ncbi:MAG: DNA polymerase III [Nanoarchaeota archaeon]|nr:DNA polymerase III [Nanoarchaeota archaeon]|tara:strand:- start:6379 stop:8085 length:1707 start_codon:yes stop_codon:yes gene_type:complete